LARSCWKLKFYTKHLFIKNKKFKKFKNKNVKKKLIIFNKSLPVLKTFIGISVNVYKGNFYRRLKISKYLIGYKFGEFVHTRKPFVYSLKKKKKNSLRR